MRETYDEQAVRDAENGLRCLISLLQFNGHLAAEIAERAYGFIETLAHYREQERATERRDAFASGWAAGRADAHATPNPATATDDPGGHGG